MSGKDEIRPRPIPTVHARGQQLGGGRFTLLRPIGRSGMGEVWLAEDEQLHESVTIKFIPAAILDDPAALNDLAHELGRVPDLHVDGALAFIVMEYVNGPTLATLPGDETKSVRSRTKWLLATVGLALLILLIWVVFKFVLPNLAVVEVHARSLASNTEPRAQLETAHDRPSSLSPREGRVGREPERGAFISPTESRVFLLADNGTNTLGPPPTLPPAPPIEKEQPKPPPPQPQPKVVAPAPQPAPAPVKTNVETAAPVFPQPDRAWVNSLGQRFVPVLNTTVLFAATAARVQDYQAFVSITQRPWKHPSFQQTALHPAVNVSWDDAVAFCAWLTTKERAEGTLSAGQYYRLPTDAEWSAAVGIFPETGATPADKDGRIKGMFPWGNDWPPPAGSGNFGRALKIDDFDHTSPVGSFKPNRYGLFDMAGNVRQWCHDSYSGNERIHTLRGSCWTTIFQESLLSSVRNDAPSDAISEFNGFRCVLVP